MMAFDTDTGQSDAALLDAFAQGSQAAARSLTMRHTGPLLSLARRMLGNEAEAEDVAQEAMLRLWKIAPDWREGDAKVSTWLYRVASNLCTDRLRKRRPSDADALDTLPDTRPGAEAGLQSQARATALEAALAELPERQRLAVTLRFLQDRPNPEVAEIMDLSVDAVESLLSRGKRALKDQLASRKDALGFSEDG